MMNTEITQRVGLIFADLATVTLLEMQLESNELGKASPAERKEVNTGTEHRPFNIQNLPTAGHA